MQTLKTEVTKEQLNLFAVVGKHYLNANNKKKSVLWVAVNELLPIAIKKLKKIEREKDLIRMKYCKKTATKHIEMDKRGSYMFTEDDNKKVLEEFDRINDEMIEMPTLIVPKGEYPESDLSFDIREGFKGIVIPEVEYELANPEALKVLLEAENERVSQEEPEEELQETE